MEKCSFVFGRKFIYVYQLHGRVKVKVKVEVKVKIIFTLQQATKALRWSRSIAVLSTKPQR